MGASSDNKKTITLNLGLISCVRYTRDRPLIKVVAHAGIPGWIQTMVYQVEVLVGYGR